MSYEGAQKIRQQYGALVRNAPFNVEVEAIGVVALLVHELIEEVHWLRNDLYNMDRNPIQNK